MEMAVFKSERIQRGITDRKKKPLNAVSFFMEQKLIKTLALKSNEC